MSGDSHRAGDGTADERDGDGTERQNWDERLFDLLATRGGREVLAALTPGFTTAARLVDRTAVSRATVYRAVDTLADLGIVEERSTVGDEGGRRRRLRLVITDMTISFRGTSLDVNYVPRDASDRFAWLLGVFEETLSEGPESGDTGNRTVGEALPDPAAVRDGSRDAGPIDSE